MSLAKTQNRMGAAIILVVLDTGGVFLAYLLAVDLTLLESMMSYGESIAFHIPYFAIFVLFWWAASVDQRLLGFRTNEEMKSYLFAVIKAVGDALVFSTVAMALLRRGGVEREFLLSFGIGTLVSIVALRLAVRTVVFALRRRGYDTRRVLIVGLNQRTEHLMDVIASRAHYGRRIVGVLDDDADRSAVLEQDGVPFLGRVEDLEKVLEQETIDEVYVSLPIRSYYESIESIGRLCETKGLPVRLVADLFPLRIARNRLMYVEDIPLLSLSPVPEAQVRLALKRAIDLLGSSLLLIILSPLFVGIAALIKLNSRGPIFFAQERVGQNQRRFNMLKFRSMVVNAEEMREDLEALNEADGPVFKIRSDPRITWSGKYLRRYSLDELPQLINVWRAQMSLVGPRPPLASEVEQYSWDQRRRLSVRPGMTGLWQVSGRSNLGFEEWVELDLAYIDSWSLVQDFFILLKTFRAVVQGRGAV